MKLGGENPIKLAGTPAGSSIYTLGVPAFQRSYAPALSLPPSLLLLTVLLSRTLPEGILTVPSGYCPFLSRSLMLDTAAGLFALKPLSSSHRLNVTEAASR